LSHSYDGFYVVDISDPAFPVRVSTTDTPGETRDLTVQGDMAYVADWTGGLRIYDVSVPSSPSLVAVDDSFDAWRVLVDGQSAYVLEVVPNVSTTLHVFDVGTPSAPVDMGQVTFATSLPWDLALRGDVLYVAGQDAGVIITDVSNPSAPAQVGSIPLMDVTDVLIANDVLYVTVANVSGGLYTYDLSDPTSPVPLGSYHVTGFFPRHVAVENGFAYCLDTFDVQLFDVSDPSNLIHLDEYRTPGDIVEVAARGDLVFVSDGQAGLRILRNDIVVTGVEEPNVSTRVTLSANRPNPFTPSTTIGFTMPADGPARLTVHTADGRRVATLLDRSVTAGEHRMTWDGRDAGGRELPPGVYFYRLETKDGVQSGRATLVR
jgi:hypothetical protein